MKYLGHGKRRVVDPESEMEEEVVNNNDEGEQRGALDMRVVKAGVDKIPLARLDKKRGERKEGIWDSSSSRSNDEKGMTSAVFARPRRTVIVIDD